MPGAGLVRIPAEAYTAAPFDVDSRSCDIAFLGDSLTEGRPGAAYFPLLQKRLPRHELLNLGRAGDTVADLLRRVTRRGLDPVDLAFIWVGVNDAVMGAWDAAGDGAKRLRLGRAPARIRGDYEALMDVDGRADLTDRVRAADRPGDGRLCPAGARRRAGRRRRRRSPARETAARALDLRPAFAAAGDAGGGPFTIDGVHFTDAGAAVVAASFATVIDEIDRGEVAAADTGG